MIQNRSRFSRKEEEEELFGSGPEEKEFNFSKPQVNSEVKPQFKEKPEIKTQPNQSRVEVKKEVTATEEILPKNKKGAAFLEKEVQLKFKPKVLLKILGGILILILVFYLGRWSVTECSTTETATAPEVELVASATEEEVTEKSTFHLLTYLKGLFGQSETKEASETTLAEPVNPENYNNTTTGASVIEPAPEETETTEVDEPIITKYSSVTLEINTFIKEWHETWGKITKMEYTITNNEEGTIKPDYIIMTLEGYPDWEKKIILPANSKLIKSHQSLSTSVVVPQGYAYNPINCGDVTSVDITLTLYDATGKSMTTIMKNANLQG